MWPGKGSVNWTGNDNTFFFLFFFFPFSPKQGVASNYEVDFLVWHRVKSEVNSQKEGKFQKCFEWTWFPWSKCTGPSAWMYKVSQVLWKQMVCDLGQTIWVAEGLPSLAEKIKLSWIKLPLPFCPRSLIRLKSLLSVRCRDKRVQRCLPWPCGVLLSSPFSR